MYRQKYWTCMSLGLTYNYIFMLYHLLNRLPISIQFLSFLKMLIYTNPIFQIAKQGRRAAKVGLPIPETELIEENLEPTAKVIFKELLLNLNAIIFFFYISQLFGFFLLKNNAVLLMLF